MKSVGHQWLGHDRDIEEQSQHQSHKYDYIADATNDNLAAGKVVRFVGRAKRVLEIGSGPGGITRVLREQNQCVITAVEIDEESAARVAPYCEQVLGCDLNDASWVNQVTPFGPFDVVVAADVLEHLVDPWLVLSQMRSVLAADGAVVVSLPHAGHNGVIACLLNGDFDYHRIGLLDRTHVRFFALKNVQQLFARASLSIAEASFVARHPSQMELGRHWDALPRRVRKVLEQNRYGSVYQVVVRAVPSSTDKPTLDLLALPMPDPRTPFRGRLAKALDEALGPRVGGGLRALLKRLVG